MSEQLNLMDLPNAISSPASADGVSPSGSQDGLMTEKCGREVVHANRLARLDEDFKKLTKDTFGLISETSLATAALQKSLENKLRARLDVNGSLEYELTWKHWPLPLGLPICALRASARRTSVKDCSGWPTPTCPSVTNGHEAGNNRFITKTKNLIGWRTPTAGDAIRGVEKNPKSRNKKAGTASLNNEAALAGWPTPNTVTGGSNSNRENRQKTGGPDLQEVAGWATPTVPRAHDSDATAGKWYPQTKNQIDMTLQILGRDLISCPVPMEKRGALNPAHSRWLMGFPAEWGFCGATAMQSIRSSRRSSSSHRKNH